MTRFTPEPINRHGAFDDESTPQFFKLLVAVF